MESTVGYLSANFKGPYQVSVLDAVGRLYGRIIKKRVVNQIKRGEDQSGFTAGRSCTDNIGSKNE